MEETGAQMTNRRWALVAGIVIGATLSLAARPSLQQALPSVPDVRKLGPQVGARVPDFALADQTGQRRSLQSLMGPKGVMLVFSRSADW